MASISPANTAFSSTQTYTTPYKYDDPSVQSLPRSYPGLHDPYSHSQGPADQQQQARPQSTPETKARLRKACDSCSVRKVKCDESGPPCKSCVALDIPCTFERPSRRRGPPNRHAEAIKRQKLEDGTYPLAESSPAHDAAYSLAALSSPLSMSQQLSAESICDISTLQILVDDYFTYIHPLIPVPHEPSFRAAFQRRDDRTDRTFLALLAAMMETLVASFPRRPRQLFTSERARRQFPSAGALIDRCHQVFNEARGLGYLDRPLTLYDAAGTYLVGLAAAYQFDVHRVRLYFGECVMMLRMLNYHKPQTSHSEPFASPTSAPQPGHEIPPVNYIERETGVRLFWLCFVGCLSRRQLGNADSDLLMPPLSRTEKLPPMPVEVDDKHIFATHINPQSPGVVSALTGFNLNVAIFRAFHNLTALEMAFGVDELFDWDRQRKIIRQALANVRAATASAPPQLQLHPEGSDDVWPSLPPSTRPDYTHLKGGSIRSVQYEIQKANIYASQLATRSYLVEKFWNLYELHDRPATSHSHSHSNSQSQIYTNSPTTGALLASGFDHTNPFSPPNSTQLTLSDEEQLMSQERESIVRSLASLLRAIHPVNLEPNGLSLCHKIRQVASTLLHTPRARMAMPSMDPDIVYQHLLAFLEILGRLERLGPSRIRGQSDADGKDGVGIEEIEEEELVHWASLRECQERFIRANGFEAMD